MYKLFCDARIKMHRYLPLPSRTCPRSVLFVLSQEAETEALLILKGAEVEKEALLLKINKTEPNTEAETGPAGSEAKTGSEAKAGSKAKAGSEAKTESAKIEPKTL